MCGEDDQDATRTVTDVLILAGRPEGFLYGLDKLCRQLDASEVCVHLGAVRLENMGEGDLDTEEPEGAEGEGVGLEAEGACGQWDRPVETAGFGEQEEEDICAAEDGDEGGHRCCDYTGVEYVWWECE